MLIENILLAQYMVNRLSAIPGTTAPARDTTARRPRVVIVGGGFGGISAARALGNRNVDVLLLSRTNYHGFWMMLYQVAAAQLEPKAIASPVRKLLRRYRNTEFRLADVRGVDLARKLVLTDDEKIPYDYLVLAAGSATTYFGNDRFSVHTLSIHDLHEAERLRDQVLMAFEQAARESDPERRTRLMSIAIVGGGPTGVELAGAFAELIDGSLRKDYPSLDMSAARVTLIDGANTVLSTFPASLQRSARRKLERLGVELRLGSAVANVDEDRVMLADGSTLGAHTIVWAAGVRGAPLADAMGVALGYGARVQVEPTLNLTAHPEVFVVGDMAYLEGYHGAPYPMVAQVAMQQGKQAAKNILALASGRVPKPFRYFDIGQMAIVGRWSAVLSTFGMRFGSIIGWLVWLFIHLVYLPGVRNRLAVLTNWLYTIVTGEAGVRTTTDDGPRRIEPARPRAIPRAEPAPQPVRVRAMPGRKRRRAA